MKKEIRSKLEANIWKYYIYQFFAGFYLIESIGILFILLADISYFQLSTIQAIGLITVLMFEIPSGALADLIGRKYSISLGSILTGIDLILIAYGFNYAFFLIAAIIGGIGGSLISGADTALVYDSLKSIKKEKSFNKILGKGKSVFYLSVVIATIIGSIIFVYSKPLVFYLNGGLFIIGGLFVLTMYEKPNQNQKFTIKKQIKHIVESFKYTLNHKRLLWLISFAICSGAFISIFHNMLRQPYMKFINIDIALFGILTAILFLSRSAISYKAHSIEEKIGETNSLYLVVLFQAIIFFSMAVVNFYLAFIFVVAIYCIWSYQEIIMEVYTNKHMNSKQRATLISIQSFFRSTFLTIAFLLVGKLVDMTSLPTSMYILSGTSLVFGIGLLLLKKKSP